MGKRNVKTIVALFLVFVMAAAMVGCAGGSNGTDSISDDRISSQSGDTSEDKKTSTDTSDGNEESKAEDSVGNGKILVAYFSYSGNTKKIAEEIQSKTGGELFEIKTVNAYSDDYNTVLDEAKAELNDKARPELSEKVKDMSRTKPSSLDIRSGGAICQWQSIRFWMSMICQGKRFCRFVLMEGVVFPRQIKISRMRKRMQK